MEVIAKQLCFHEGRRRPGERFEHPAKSVEELPAWLEPVKPRRGRKPADNSVDKPSDEST